MIMIKKNNADDDDDDNDVDVDGDGSCAKVAWWHGNSLSCLIIRIIQSFPFFFGRSGR